MEGIYHNTPTPLENSNKLHTFPKSFWPLRTPPPTPRNFLALLWGGVWTFSGTTHYNVRKYIKEYTKICSKIFHF